MEIKNGPKVLSEKRWSQLTPAEKESGDYAHVTSGLLTDLRVREVPPALKAQLKSEAALTRKTLNEYVLEILGRRKEVLKTAARKK
jgi:hypothetical protein